MTQPLAKLVYFCSIYISNHSIMPTKISPTSSRLKLAVGVGLLLSGCLIYLTWRSEDIRLHTWCSWVGLKPLITYLRSTLGSLTPGKFITFSLPDGLFCAAYILIMDAIWAKSKPLFRLTMALLMPAIAVIHETLQAFHLAGGTFDAIDLLCYLLPALVFIATCIRPFPPVSNLHQIFIFKKIAEVNKKR